MVWQIAVRLETLSLRFDHLKMARPDLPAKYSSSSTVLEGEAHWQVLPNKGPVDMTGEYLYLTINGLRATC